MTHIITSQATSELGYRADPADIKNEKIRRITPDKKVLETASRSVANFVSVELHQRISRYKLADDQLSSLLAPARDALKQDKEGAARVAALRKAQEAAAVENVRRRKPTHPDSTGKLLSARQTLMSLQPGLNFLAPPWDMSFFNPNPPNFPFEFANGNVFSETGLYVATRDSYTGQILGDGGSGSASAGFGFFISSPVDRTAAFRPFMPYNYSWDDDSTWGYTAHTSGGPAFIVYEAGAPNPSKTVFLNLWDDGTSWSHDGDAESGYMLDHFDGVNNSFPMTAGATYLVIFLIWGHADCSGKVFDIFGSAAGSVSAFNMSTNLDFVVIV
jgi:hypothetical protein